MNETILIIILPVLAGILLFLLPAGWKLMRGLWACLVAAAVLVLVLLTGNQQVGIFSVTDFWESAGWQLPAAEGWVKAAGYCSWRVDALSGMILLFTALLALLISVYTLASTEVRQMRNFHAWFLITLGFTLGAIAANNLLLFLVCWGILGITLYLLIPGKDAESASAAKKSLVMMGASDGIMILGVAILWRITGTLQMDQVRIPTSDLVRSVAFLALITGAFTKAGAFPFHTWIPGFAEKAPAASSAYLPASLDKLLGIYFLARITQGLFIPGDGMRMLILSLGVITLITAVIMALVQHDYKKLLGYHAVSQVGYMVLGFGLGTALGVAAGLFHMVNNALYKSGLFLAAGAVEQRTGKADLGALGGLSKSMPVTFAAVLIFALSISGIPPLNGFASKWMIYQGIIDFGGGSGLSNQLWVVWLGLAVLGSALTLASFIKFTGGIFLGRRPEEFPPPKEASPLMWLPMTLLALACVLFGVLSSAVVIPRLLEPVAGTMNFPGIWSSATVGILVVVSILLGVLVYLMGNPRNVRTSDSFVGGESLQEEVSYPAPEFYKSFQEFGWLASLIRNAKRGWFDLYELFSRFFGWLGGILSRSHTGILHDYALWVCAGLVILLLLFIT